MRKILILVAAALFFGTASAKAQQPTFAQIGNPCLGSPVYGNAQWCFDTPTTANPSIYYNNAGVWTYVSGQNQAHYQTLIIKSPTVMCTTSNSAGAVCSEPTQTFSPLGFADANYVVNCTCASVGTNVPIVQAVTKASNTLVVTVAAMSAASASCAEVDCALTHP